MFFSLVGGIRLGLRWGKQDDIPFVATGEYSIGIYTGDSPFSIWPADGIDNPVLTAEDVTDIPAHYVADPFMVRVDNSWYMFFEILNAETNQGDIGLAISPDGFNWQYEQVVIDEEFHLSYPYIFNHEGNYFMILYKEKRATGLGLYIADRFPANWSYVRTMLKGSYYDPSIFYYREKWWLFAEENHGFLHLYYADELTGIWAEHPESPIVRSNPNISRPGGRVLVTDDEVIRFAQGCYPAYGTNVQAFRIIRLTTSEYQEEEIPANPIITATGKGWNADGMHHMDAHRIGENRWIACVDGNRDHLLFGWKY
jgi:hypothetical protein